LENPDIESEEVVDITVYASAAEAGETPQASLASLPAATIIGKPALNAAFTASLSA
jgi:hypothetical protein